MPSDITTFFEAYRDAFNALDADRIAQLYAVPSGIAQAGAYTYWPEYEPILENMASLCKQYEDRGFVQADFEPSEFIPQGEQYAIANLRWRVQWGAGQEAWQFSTTYNLVRTAAGWRVLLCTAYTEDKLHTAASAA